MKSLQGQRTPKVCCSELALHVHLRTTEFTILFIARVPITYHTDMESSESQTEQKAILLGYKIDFLILKIRKKTTFLKSEN